MSAVFRYSFSRTRLIRIRFGVLFVQTTKQPSISIQSDIVCIKRVPTVRFAYRNKLDNYYPAAVIEDTDKEKTITYDRRSSTVRYD